MGQRQRKIEVKMLDGTILAGRASGNAAAWLCTCDRQQPLIVDSWLPNRSVQCPSCKVTYRLYPENNQKGGRIMLVEECEPYKAPLA